MIYLYIVLWIYQSMGFSMIPETNLYSFIKYEKFGAISFLSSFFYLS